MKAEAAKLPGAGTSPKQWLKKMRAEKGWLTGLDESRYDGRTRSTCVMKKRSRMYARMLPVGRTVQKRASDGIASLGLGNQRRVKRRFKFE